jgi:hypothetical protein
LNFPSEVLTHLTLMARIFDFEATGRVSAFLQFSWLFVHKAAETENWCSSEVLLQW